MDLPSISCLAMLKLIEIGWVKEGGTVVSWCVCGASYRNVHALRRLIYEFGDVSS